MCNKHSYIYSWKAKPNILRPTKQIVFLKIINLWIYEVSILYIPACCKYIVSIYICSNNNNVAVTIIRNFESINE